MSTSPTTTPRRVPPPCWTHDETLALINAYGARWLSLNRGNLRTSDWDAVSSAVSGSNLGATKSSVQCRHKIEKLRKRYRAEKQRSLSFPGRFVSSWDLFPLLDSMNFGSSLAAGFRVKLENDNKLMSKFGNIDGHLNQYYGLNHDLRSDFSDDFEGGFGLDTISDGNFANLDSRANSSVKIDGDLKYNNGFKHGFGVGFGVKMQGDRKSVPQGVRLKRYREVDDDKSRSGLDYDYTMDEFPLKTIGDRVLVPPPGFKPKNYSEFRGNFNPNSYNDHDAGYGMGNGSGSEFHAKRLGDRDVVPSKIRLKNYGRHDRNLNGNVDFRVTDGCGSPSRLRDSKKNGGGAAKRGLDPVEELVSSVTLLTERFLKVEKMKMEMAMETHKMRMEMETKHNQMILESQQHILDGFVTGLLEKKRKKKVKVEVTSPNTTGNGEGLMR